MGNIVLIPARGGSKGIKNKNITNVAGNPLIYYVSYSAQKSKHTDKIYVGTDSEKIANVAMSFGFNKLQIYKRLKKNAADTSKTIDFVLEFVKKLEEDDVLILIQATSPLTTSEDIDNAINLYQSSDCDSLFSAVNADGFYWNKNGEPVLHDYKNRQRRQEYEPELLRENGAIYINKVKNIIKNKSLLSGKIRPFIMAPETKTEIDTYDDIYTIEKIFRQRIYKNFDFSNYKMLLCDCDGTMTDGGMYYSHDGELLKKFNTKDGFGLKEIKDRGYITGIITGEISDIVKKRAEKLKITELHMGADDKLKIVKKIAKKYGISLNQIIYIGDDMNDYEVIKSVGFGCATQNAVSKLKQIAKYVTKLSGGMGAVREVTDMVIYGS